MSFELKMCRWPQGNEGIDLGNPFANAPSVIGALSLARDTLWEKGMTRLYPVTVVVDGQVGLLVHDPNYEEAVFIPRLHLTDDRDPWANRTSIPVA